MSISVGDCLGRYEVLGPIGAGGMGEVWQARDSDLGREVAVKMLPKDFASDENRLERFHREAKALAALSHPNLLDIYDVGEADGIHYAVTELLEGDTLRERITPSGLPWKKVATIGAAVADGLAAAHGRGIIHRDLKPENLFITADGRVKILDFGLASMHEQASPDAETATITDAGTVMGTPGYMAPEQVKGRQADSRSDIFSLGCVLYEMASGRRAFGGDTGVEVIAAVLKEEPPQLSSSGARVPVDLERAVHRCLEKHPEARFQSAADLAYSLQNMGASPSTPVMATPGSRDEARAGKKRRWWQIALAGALVFVAVVIAWQAITKGGVEQVPLEVASTLNPNRIAVAPFANRTGDASLDNLAALTANRLEQGLAELDEVDVAPASTVSAAGAGVDPAILVREVAKGTDSRLVLTGVWDAVGAGLELQATLEDVQQGTVVHAFDPIPADREAPQEAITILRDWTLMALQDHLHPILAWGAGDRFPIYQAYLETRHYLETEGIDHIYRAPEIDPEFARPRILIGGIWFPGIVPDRRERMVRFYEPVREMTLNAEQQRLVDMIDRRLSGNWEGAFRIALEELNRDPADSFRQWQVVRSAGWANRPRAAIDVFNKLGYDPLLPTVGKTLAVNSASNALHRLGRHDEELALAQGLVAAGPVSTLGGSASYFELKALAALGRMDEINAVLSDVFLEPDSEVSSNWELMLSVVHELRAHGFDEEAQPLAERAVARVDTDPSRPAGSKCSRCQAWALMAAGRHGDARPVFEDMLADTPDSRSLIEAVGLCAARLGDRAEALEMEMRLEELGAEVWPSGVPIFHGQNEFMRAGIAAQLGDRDRAILLIQQAIAAGYWNYGWTHSNPEFESLWNEPEFQEILRPKG